MISLFFKNKKKTINTRNKPSWMEIKRSEEPANLHNVEYKKENTEGIINRYAEISRALFSLKLYELQGASQC